MERKGLAYNRDSAMSRQVEKYLEWMIGKGYSEYTASSRWYELRYFIVWSEERGIGDATEVTTAILERYRTWLHHRRLGDGRAYTSRAQYSRLMSLRGFFKWLKKEKKMAVNPALEMEMPKVGKPLPRNILSKEEMELVLEQVNPEGKMGLRDRAVLEVFYSTGLRRSELRRLLVDDIDMERGVVFVREGKGKKDRVVPIGERALHWVVRYLDELRGRLARLPDEGVLFLNKLGKAMSDDNLSYMAGQYVGAAGLGKKGSCHLFRHTMATLMLEGGADIRYIQEMLGHARLETTQIYTKVSIRKLKEVYERTHPGAKLSSSRAGRKTG